MSIVKVLYQICTSLIVFILGGALLTSLVLAKEVHGSTVPNKLLTHNATIKQMIAQKIVLDFRYYCGDERSGKGSRCVKAMTELPPELAEFIAKTDLGGVILFSENLNNPRQIAQLTRDLKRAAAKSTLGLPLFISVDQEGGRVARLPREYFPAFSGNMAIAATHNQHGDKYAKLTGKSIGQMLSSLGFNLNFAPNVDVNVNPNNPVINVRSFGEEPNVVGYLAAAQLDAMQQNGVLGTLKHFPGHGDTNVDSHTGLPRVNHNKSTIREIDLAPFQYAIERNLAHVIMTAHIQYPELDNSEFVSKNGKRLIKPATMSKKILTDLLREEMGYQGLVITDALDMKGISDFYGTEQAVLETFNAGADIALMPLAIRTRDDLKRFEHLLATVTSGVKSERLSSEQVVASFQRIVATKRRFLSPSILADAQSEIATGLSSTDIKQMRALEAELATSALTKFKGTGRLPRDIKRIHLLLPDANKCLAFNHELTAVKALSITCSDMLSMNLVRESEFISKAQAFVIGNITPEQSVVEIGGMEDLSTSVRLKKERTFSKRDQDKTLLDLLKVAKQQQKHTVFISLRMPNEVNQFAAEADHVLATFAYNQHEQINGQWTGPTYKALAELLVGEGTANGQSPITIETLN